jgi:hypothetical protein
MQKICILLIVVMAGTGVLAGFEPYADVSSSEDEVVVGVQYASRDTTDLGELSRRVKRANDALAGIEMEEKYNPPEPAREDKSVWDKTPSWVKWLGGVGAVWLGGKVGSEAGIWDVKELGWDRPADGSSSANGDYNTFDRSSTRENGESSVANISVVNSPGATVSTEIE